MGYGPRGDTGSIGGIGTRGRRYTMTPPHAGRHARATDARTAPAPAGGDTMQPFDRPRDARVGTRRSLRAMAGKALAVVAAAAGFAAALPGDALAQAGAWPVRPIRIIVPAATGGPDTVARLLAPSMAASLGQPVLVENRPGANGILGADLVAKAPPDGYTLMVYSSGFVVAPAVVKKLPYDTEKDFAPIANLATNLGIYLVVLPSHPAKTLTEFIETAKRPGANVTFSSPGIGNTLHLLGELFNAQAGTRLVHVPYKGGGPAMAAVLSGEVTTIFGPPQLAAAHMRAGKVRALAYSLAERSPAFPDVPTMREAGLPDYVADGGWFGMFAPANTPVDVINRLNGEVRKALADATIRERLQALGFGPVGDSPEQFRKTVSDEIRKYGEMARLANIQPE
jgi:tripartite-type tricarboxylate transporter receptor subunit TctC